MKLATQLSLLIVSALLIAIAAMGAFFAFNLERGFVAYINAQQLRQLEALAQSAARLAQRFGTLEPLIRDRRLWTRLLRETEDGNVAFVPEPPHRPAGERPPWDADGRPGRPPPFREFAEGRPPPPPPVLPPADSMGIARRFFVLGPDRHLPPGEPLPPAGSRAPIEREIRVGDRIEGYIVHYPYERVSRAEDLAFLRSQFMGVALVALALLLAGMLAAPLVARRWTRHLREIGKATGRIARGELDVRVGAGGAREIEALAADVNAMAASLRSLDASRRRWIAQSAHELRTPLMVLRGEIEALQDGVRPVDARALASLAEETRHLAKLVDDLHLVAVADMEGLRCRLERVDLGPIVQRAVERFRERASARGLALSLHAAEGPMPVDADEDRLAQLLDNLFENSLRYTDSPGRIEVTLGHEGPAVRLRVEDTPPGVSRDECARLFEPLERASKARTRREGGSGLGLAICRAIAKAHGAALSAEPSALGGLAVTLLFPRPE